MAKRRGATPVSKDAARRSRLELLIERYVADCFARRTAPQGTELAALIEANRGHLSETVKRVFGRSLSAILHAAQVRYAAQLLKTTDLSVEEIGTAAGFGHRATFFRRFKSLLGVTPTEYRDQNRQIATSDLPSTLL